MIANFLFCNTLYFVINFNLFDKFHWLIFLKNVTEKKKE